jgi:glucose/arabinose dehydrogenase
VTQFARGLRNPFDLIWDDVKQRVIVADNGPGVGDDVNILEQGANCGWPFTFANEPAAPGVSTPAYVFRNTVAPTGTIALNGANPQLRAGVLVGAYVTKAIYFFPDIDATPLPDPIALIQRETGPVIDVAQSRGGDLFFATGDAIYQLIVPVAGDCDGDGHLSSADLEAFDSGEVPRSKYDGIWGCDANGDGLISPADRDVIARLTAPRRRAVRR